MYKYFPDLQNGVDDADVTQLIDAFNEIEDDITALQNKNETDPTVPSWAKEPQKPTYTADEVGALPSDTKIPTKISDLENDLTELQDVINDVGDLGNLSTENKDNLVNAINELHNKGIKPYIVTKLPTENIDENGIYIVTDNSGTIGGGGAGGGANGGHYYGEIVCDATAWVRTNGEWLRIGVVKNTIGDAIDVAKEQIYQSIGSVSGSVLTLERLISGDGISLETNADTIIGAINEIKDAVSAEKTDREEADIEIKENIGDIESLTTDDKSSLVNAINEVKSLREEADTALASLLEWKLICEAQITEADVENGEYPTAITVDLGKAITNPIDEWYSETMVQVTVPASSNINSTNGRLTVNFGENEATSLQNYNEYGLNCLLIAPQQGSGLGLYYGKYSRATVISEWIDNILQHTVLVYDSHDSPGYSNATYGTINSRYNNITNKRYLSIYDRDRTFKFPAGSKVSLYGRL